ncbi:MAG: hypothetical protein ACFFCS_06685 [Candidatus Hodarchaeota archaeon]
MAIPGWFYKDDTGSFLSAVEITWRVAEFGIFITFLIFTIYFLSRYLKSRNDNPIQAPFNLGYTVFFAVMVINQVFFISKAFSKALNIYLYNSISLYAASKPFYSPDLQIIYLFLFFDISFAFFIFPYEKYFNRKKKHVISILLLLGIAAAAVTVISGAFILDVGNTGNASLIAFAGIIHPIGALLILIAFFAMIVGSLTIYFRLVLQTSGLIKNKSLATAIGFLTWFASVFCNAIRGEIDNISPLLGLLGPITFYTGTFLIAYGFKGIMSAVIDFYQSKHICIVHRGVVEGKLFVCTRCNVFYCTQCKDAIAAAENRCWNCNDLLDKSLELNLKYKAGTDSFQKFVDLKKWLNLENDRDAFGILLEIGKNAMALSKEDLTPAGFKSLIGGLLASQGEKEDEGKIAIAAAEQEEIEFKKRNL